MDFKELFIENVSFLDTFAKTKFDNVLYYSRMTAFGGNRNLSLICFMMCFREKMEITLLIWAQR